MQGFPQVELVPGGADVSVTLENLSEYVQLVLQKMLLDSVAAQMEAFSNGFSEVTRRPLSTPLDPMPRRKPRMRRLAAPAHLKRRVAAKRAALVWAGNRIEGGAVELRETRLVCR